MRDTFMNGASVGRDRDAAYGGGTTMAKAELLRKLDAAIAEKSLLKHPLYQDWEAGKLSREALQLYAAQYYRHVEAFPKHLRVLAAQVFRKRLHVPVVLRCIKLQRLSTQLPRLPILIQRMLQ